MTKYQAYKYEGGDNIYVGKSRIALEPGDIFCIITQTQAKINNIVIEDVVFSEFLHSSKYLGDYSMAEYGTLVQEFLNKKHGLPDEEPQELPFEYADVHPCLGSVEIKRHN